MTWKTIDRKPYQSNFVSNWHRVIFLAGVFSLFIDFLFLYIHTLDSEKSSYMDWHLGARIAVLRSVADLFVIWGMIIKFHTQFKAFERQELRKEARYTKLSFIVDLISVLPIPQVCVALKITTLTVYVVAQIPFRVGAVSTHYHRAKIRGILMKNAWSGALLNLFYFIMTSHGMGAYFYDFYISTIVQCTTLIDRDSDFANLDWDEVLIRCNKKSGYDYGIVSDAFTTKIGTRSFIQKYTYCLAWGLKSLSSFGQIFSASSYPNDTGTSLLVVIFGLVLFGDLLARMQTGLQCTEKKEDRQRTRQRMVEEWMKYHQLPPHLKKQVQQAIQSEWSATRGINSEAFVDSLPWDIRREIRKHLYLEIIRTMPLFAGMDEDLVTAICGYLKTFSACEGTYVAFEGEPVYQMLFVFSGQLEVSNGNNGGQCMSLGPGELCGKELLEWCSHPTTSTENLKPATQTIKCITAVDAFALRVHDVKLLAIQFHRDGKFHRAFQRYAT